ncbi:MAG: TIR domain-containing protein [Rhodothermales bacterium]
MLKLSVLILSSSESYEIAKGVARNLRQLKEGGKDVYKVQTWGEGFFRHKEAFALNTFLKQLLYFDLAVIVAGPDDVQHDRYDADKTVNVPRDNVVFELGATCARFGTHRTFLLVPKSRTVKLPSYFKGINVVEYDDSPDSDHIVATSDAVDDVHHAVQGLQGRVHQADLPALGLAYGYLHSFVKPLITSIESPQVFHDAGLTWEQGSRYTIAVVIPERLMNRKEIDYYCLNQLGLQNESIKLRNGRDVSVYIVPRVTSADPLHIVDVPTTFFTSHQVIRLVDQYWEGGGDMEYRDRLMEREIRAFERQLRSLFAEDENILPEDVTVVQAAGAEEYVAALSV